MKKANTDHSPLPWLIEDNQESDFIDIVVNPGYGEILRIARGYNAETNAKFIVRACNNAERLAKAATKALEELESSGGVDGIGDPVEADQLIIEELRAALAEFNTK